MQLKAFDWAGLCCWPLGHSAALAQGFAAAKAGLQRQQIQPSCTGAGGSLEDFDPTNTWFGHKKARYHHLVYVGIHGDQLEFQAIDQHGKLFDTLTLTKRP